MKTCSKCNVTILDDTDRCPLCRHALSGDEQGINAYPDAVANIRKARFFENMVLFLSILASAIMLTVNILTPHETYWSLAVILAIFYGNVALRYAILGKSGYLIKGVGMILIAVFVLLGIDYLTGFYRWSMTYVYPALIMAADLVILILMAVNRRNWQSYMMVQLLMFLLSLLSIVFYQLGLNIHPLVGGIASGISLAIFLGTLILGDERAKNEMKRRFFI